MKTQKFYLIAAKIVDSNFPDDIESGAMQKNLVEVNMTKEDFKNLQKLDSVNLSFFNKKEYETKTIEKNLDAYLSMDYIPYNRVIQALKKALKKAEKKPHMTIEDVEVDVSENDDEVIMERLTPVQEMEFTPVTRFCEMCGIEAD